MGIFSIITLVLVIAGAATGAVAGTFKGFTKVKSWAFELLLVGVIAIPLGGLVASSLGGGVASGAVTLGIVIILIIVFLIVFACLRKMFKKHIQRRKTYEYYSQFEERESNEEQILQAIEEDDKKQFKKLTKRKFRQKSGVWGVLDRILGAFTLAIKGAVICGLTVAVVLAAVDFTRLAQEGAMLSGVFADTLNSDIWLHLKNYLFDFIIILIISSSIKAGYAHGLSGWVWSVCVLGMVAGAGFLSWSLASSAEFAGSVNSLSGKLNETLGGAGEMLEGAGVSVDLIAQLIITLLLFLLMLVAVILLAVFVPKLLKKAREGVIFHAIDGALGSVLLTAFTVAILLLVGTVINSMHDVAFMQVFNAYFEKSAIATYFYDNNILNAAGLLTNLPFGEMLS